MSCWTLLEQRDADSPLGRYQLRADQGPYVILSDRQNRVAALDALKDGERPPALARLTIAGWGVKLEALETLVIEPGNPRTNALIAPNKERYTLTRSSEQLECIFLRENDKIYLRDTSANIHMVLKYDPSEVQVDSSVAADAEIPESDPKSEQDETSETDDEDLDRTLTITATLSNGHRSQATPVPSIARSEVVQETPAANRTFTENDLLAAGEQRRKASDTVGKPLEDMTLTDAAPDEASPSETTGDGVNADGKDLVEENHLDAEEGTVRRFDEVSTAAGTAEVTVKSATNTKSTTQPKAKRNPRKSPAVQIPASEHGVKRKLDVLEPIADELPTSRTRKRAKKPDAASQESVLSADKLAASRKSTPAKRHRRSDSSADDIEKSPDSSGSSVAGSQSVWQSQERPMVAFSNSATAEMPALMKFLKAHGGTKVETVEKGECNLLVVRDGPLRKSMKLLSCVALGIPIVTDKWLTESSKKKRLLNPEHFKPTVPDQEREWDFSLDKVWGKPQTNTLKGYTVYFTPALRKSYQDFKELDAVCRVAGARAVETRPASQVKSPNRMIFLGLEEGDPGSAALMEAGYAVYTRDFLTCSILRGEIDLDSDEFRILPLSDDTTRRGGRKKAKKA